MSHTYTMAPQYHGVLDDLAHAMESCGSAEAKRKAEDTLFNLTLAGYAVYKIPEPELPQPPRTTECDKVRAELTTMCDGLAVLGMQTHVIRRAINMLEAQEAEIKARNAEPAYVAGRIEGFARAMTTGLMGDD